MSHAQAQHGGREDSGSTSHADVLLTVDAFSNVQLFPPTAAVSNGRPEEVRRIAGRRAARPRQAVYRNRRERFTPAEEFAPADESRGGGLSREGANGFWRSGGSEPRQRGSDHTTARNYSRTR